MTSPVEALQRDLEQVGYYANSDLACTVWLSLSMHRPLFCEGQPGVGKTALAQALATVGGVPLIRLQCYEGIQAHHALYDWDFPRQVLQIQAGRDGDVWSSDFLLARPVLHALQTSTPGRPAVLLIDEIDRADDEFDAFLLEFLDTWTVTIPEIGTIRAATPPVVVITSNRTRDVHDALKRRCLYQFLELPTPPAELAILRRHVPEASTDLLTAVVERIGALRSGHLVKPPGLAEAIDWARALSLLDVSVLDEHSIAQTLPTVVKHADDLALARAVLI